MYIVNCTEKQHTHTHDIALLSEIVDVPDLRQESPVRGRIESAHVNDPRRLRHAIQMYTLRFPVFHLHGSSRSFQKTPLRIE